MAQGVFYLLYQPKVSLATGKIVGVEALARKRDPVLGELAPCKFLPLMSAAEVESMTFTLLHVALADQAAWKAAGLDVVLSFNAPAGLIALPSTLPRLLRCVHAHDADPSRLTIEVTEAEDPARVQDFRAIAKRLRDGGFGLAIDDFGAGYSSILSLISIPYTELKIDRAIVHRASTDGRRMAALEASAGLGRRLNMLVTAEGAEDADDLGAVRTAGCDLVQGFVTARPLQSMAIPSWKTHVIAPALS